MSRLVVLCQALALAAEALEQGEFPIAAVVVLDDEIIAQATLPSSVRSAS